MLSKKDKEWITSLVSNRNLENKEWVEKTIERYVISALTIRVKMERKRDLETGLPLAIPVKEEKDIFLPSFWVDYLPFYEAAVRGCQEDIDKLKNNVSVSNEILKQNSDNVERLANIFIGVEKAIKVLASVSVELRKRLIKEGSNDDTLIEYNIDKQLKKGEQ